MEFQTFKAQCLPLIDQTAITFIQGLSLAPKLKEAIAYSFQAGGKRIRPLLLLAVLDAYNIPIEKGLKTASSLELIHTSSLIHDDLPCMDDDDYRRGQLTNHKVFGEATAVLAGDALLVNAFELIASDPLLQPEQRVALVKELAIASGANGMIGGQELDIENEERALTLEELQMIHAHKTGKLLEFALVAGAIIAGASLTEQSYLRHAAQEIGLAFQIKDDILDVIGDQAIIGKATNRDLKNHKTTYVSLLGLKEAEARLIAHYEQALHYLSLCNRTFIQLTAIFKLIVERNQ